jgi:hypothetical protein
LCRLRISSSVSSAVSTTASSSFVMASHGARCECLRVGRRGGRGKSDDERGESSLVCKKGFGRTGCIPLASLAAASLRL